MFALLIKENKMRTKMDTMDLPMQQVTIDDVLHGAGLELMLKAEELIYATPTLDEEGCEQLGSDLYLLARVLGAILAQHTHNLRVFRVVLPDDVGVVRVKNPYYARGSEKPADSAAGQSDGNGGEFPF